MVEDGAQPKFVVDQVDSPVFMVVCTVNCIFFAYKHGLQFQ